MSWIHRLRRAAAAARSEGRAPRWLTWYGYAWASSFGLPGRTPSYDEPVPNDLERFLDVDLDDALRRLLAEDMEK